MKTLNFTNPLDFRRAVDRLNTAQIEVANIRYPDKSINVDGNLSEVQKSLEDAGIYDDSPRMVQTNRPPAYWVDHNL
jgi:hypothetical protein